MVAVILWGVGDVVYIIYEKLIMPPALLLNINDIFYTFGAFMAVLITVEIFINIRLYLGTNVFPVQLVVATALMAIARNHRAGFRHADADIPARHCSNHIGAWYHLLAVTTGQSTSRLRYLTALYGKGAPAARCVLAHLLLSTGRQHQGCRIRFLHMLVA